jgi:hypothetical protein
MTSSDHSRILAIAHLAYGAISALGIVGVAVGIIGMIGIASVTRFLFPDHSELLLGGLLLVEVILAWILMLVTLAVSLPFLATGYALLKDRSWVKYSGIAAIVLSIMTFPVGTFLSVYTIWYLFIDKKSVN